MVEGLEDILNFVTGSSEEPLLGFGFKPSIHFSDAALNSESERSNVRFHAFIRHHQSV